MTQNLYVGTNTTALLQSTPANIAANIAAAENSIAANNFPARAGAIAGEAASAGGPLLIGLQEAVILSTPSKTLDYAQILLNQLAARGLDYTIAGEHTDLQVSLDGFSATDREVVLARTGVPGFAVTGSQDYTFKNNVTLQTPIIGPVTFDRGDVLVNASLDGQPFQFVSTHLDEFHTAVQPLQAGEIVSQLGAATVPQLVVGDFNAAPATATYQEMISNDFVDTAAAVGAAGATCCQAADLSNPASQLSQRYDYVFERGFSSIDSAFLVGNTPFEDVRPLWPSDHAGVVATVNVNVPEPPAGMIFLTALLLLGILRVRPQLTPGRATPGRLPCDAVS